MKNKDLSKFLSLLLRHQPDKLNLTMDENGWASVNELLTNLNQSGRKVNFAQLQAVVDTNNKQRFKLDVEHNRIRANQGHSLLVDVQLLEALPPNKLYHGTAAIFLDDIRKKGLLTMNRQHVHLSSDIETARQVGSRHGQPIILEIDCVAMVNSKYKFYCSENGVWLTGNVPVDFINFGN